MVSQLTHADERRVPTTTTSNGTGNANNNGAAAGADVVGSDVDELDADADDGEFADATATTTTTTTTTNDSVDDADIQTAGLVQRDGGDAANVANADGRPPTMPPPTALHTSQSQSAAATVDQTTDNATTTPQCIETQQHQHHRHHPTNTLRSSSPPSSTATVNTTTTSSPTPSTPSSPSSSASSSCDTTCIHIVDPNATQPIDAAPPTSSLPSRRYTETNLNELHKIHPTHQHHNPHHHHQRHHSTTGVIAIDGNVDRPRQLATSAAPAGASGNGAQLPARTRSDDDCDYDSVVLRTKTTDAQALSSNASSMDRRSNSTPLHASGGETTSSSSTAAAAAGSHRPDIDQIRAFLESEYQPGADGCWTSTTTASGLHQRDSFIHRSYNKKLLARKNAIDEIPKMRPASMPAVPRPPPPVAATTAATITIGTTAAPNPISEPIPTAAIKRDSFLRNSLNSIRRSFSLRSSSSKKHSKAAASAAAAATAAVTTAGSASAVVGDDTTTMNDSKRKGRRKRNASKTTTAPATTASASASVNATASGTDETPHSQMMANNNSYLHGDGYAQSDSTTGVRTSGGGCGSGDSMYLNVPLENVRNYGHSRNSSTSSCTSQRSTNSAALGGHIAARPTSAGNMAPLQSHHSIVGNAGSGGGGSDPSVIHYSSTMQPTVGAAANVRTSIRNASQQQSQSTGKLDTKSIRHLQTSTPAGSVSSTTTPSPPVLRSPSPHSAKLAAKDAAAAEKKEKKRKELSSGRQKKFRRHFQQVAADEHVINYFSCALVSDILLQGHLYITDHYFAFYSNVFGFVTKLLIPTVSVVRISKEKTAKIIPNAIGVATADERHVFGSFMSRETAYRLMLSVWLPVAAPEANAAAAMLLPSVSGGSGTDAHAAKRSLSPSAEPGVAAAAAAADVAAPGDASLEDESSSAMSGNERDARPQQQPIDSTASTDASASGVRQRKHEIGTDTVDSQQHQLLHHIQNAAQPTSPPQPTHANAKTANNHFQSNSIDAKQQRSTVLSPQLQPNTEQSAVSLRRFYEMDLPPRLMHVGYVITVLLLVLSVYLLWRIWTVSGQMQQQQASNVPSDFGGPQVNWETEQNIDVYAEVLKWQRQMQTKGVDEAQIILNSNLEQIAKVRKSLETLSILIHNDHSGALNLPDVINTDETVSDAIAQQ